MIIVWPYRKYPTVFPYMATSRQILLPEGLDGVIFCIAKMWNSFPNILLKDNKWEISELAVSCGNCLREQFEPLLREKYRKFHDKYVKKNQKNAGKPDLSNWNKHIKTKKVWKQWQKSMPYRMVERIHEKYPFLHTKEVWICCLLYFNFKPCEIAEMLGYNKITIHTKASGIRKKLKISEKSCITRFFEENPWFV